MAGEAMDSSGRAMAAAFQSPTAVFDTVSLHHAVISTRERVASACATDACSARAASLESGATAIGPRHSIRASSHQVAGQSSTRAARIGPSGTTTDGAASPSPTPSRARSSGIARPSTARKSKVSRDGPEFDAAASSVDRAARRASSLASPSLARAQASSVKVPADAGVHSVDRRSYPYQSWIAASRQGDVMPRAIVAMPR